MLQWFVRLKGYALAATFVVLATLATAAIPFNSAPSYLLLLISILATAWYSGSAAAISAIAIATIFSHVVFHERGADEIVRLGLFLLASAAITVWVHREKSLKAAVDESNQRFRLVMGSVTEYAILITNPDGLIVDWNTGAERIIGMDDSDKGRSLEMIFPPHDQAAFVEEMAKAEKTGQATDEKWHRRKDGSQFWAYGILTTLRDTTGTVEGYVKILRDLTGEKLAQEERNRLVAEIEKKNTLLEQMMAVLAHDIRAPLTAVLGWTSLRKDGVPLDPDRVEHILASVERNARKQLELMEGLLEWFRVRSGQVQPPFQRCDGVEILRECLDTIQFQARAKDIQVEQAWECEKAIIVANSAWLAEVFTNVLSNAVKFTPSGGRIRVSCRQSPASLRVEISDTGIGIPST